MEFWDDLHEEWVVIRQAPNHSPTQVSGRYAVPDMKNWTLDHYFSPDAHDSSDPWHFDEVYRMMSAYLERIVFGFAAWFIGDETHPTVKGNCLIGFNTSRDVVEVRHVTSREPWISHGSGHDSYGHQVRLDCSPLRTGDEDWLYGTVVNGDHGVGRGGYGPRTPVIRGPYTRRSKTGM